MKLTLQAPQTSLNGKFYDYVKNIHHTFIDIYELKNYYFDGVNGYQMELWEVYRILYSNVVRHGRIGSEWVYEDKWFGNATV